MELPVTLRARIDALLTGRPIADLAEASGRLTQRYRAETRDGSFHLHDDRAAAAYVAARLPATFAAVRAALEAVAQARPDLAPASLLDAGAGPGTALWAAVDVFGTLGAAELLEASPAIRDVGERLCEGAFAFQPTWRAADLLADPTGEPADLVTLSYVLDELPPARIGPLCDVLWSRTRRALVVVEPGTPAGWRRILAVRDQLLAQGAHVGAPCAHEAACPIREPDWCHFAQRVARSRVHLRTKGAEVPFEDEKFSYVALLRDAPDARAARVLAPPRGGSGKVHLKLCRPDGSAAEELVTRRDGERFRRARRLDWGDGF
ncbi:small ribosomal subunit Rsm22 family protein [Aureimonas jatrophae]|uniref:Ribosomal protein RSM22 (Predicted rRNA methylase) n=1 Tax=Aureimonas jatrophae TaxID=1166073 RepID=A0A1H0IH19_9HYPH|nr:small ribosomal subunit Rsm22 family protein [Aureimonas jatrophae]MBB3952165.1 ribosomal protein RSM22 (predicted rRNA methylase) [Aureimonas jatrophae]SDO30698.1 Ribosomal protein RSM22 (predicted rRNA methylase) [Aureimonas jatrophae]